MFIVMYMFFPKAWLTEDFRILHGQSNEVLYEDKEQ